MRVFSLLFIITILITGCENSSKRTPKIHWDRDMCQMCKMVISQRKFVVVVTEPLKSKKYFFDDIGCAILWFKQENISWQKDAKIYIADAKNGEFIDAKKAYYDFGATTPMDYGFSAYKNRDDIKYKNNIMNFNEVRLKILRGETMQNPLIKQKLEGKRL